MTLVATVGDGSFPLNNPAEKNGSCPQQTGTSAWDSYGSEKHFMKSLQSGSIFVTGANIIPTYMVAVISENVS